MKLLKNLDKSQLLSANDLITNNLYEIIDSPHHNGQIVVRIKDSIYEINDFSDFWHVNTVQFKFRKLNPGESVTLTQE